jgi:23S rRNA (cytosine1962-C5)-methyltransferase
MGISYLIETTLPSTDYELLDSGDGEKLERYGDVIVARPDPQALWPKSLSKEEWNKVTAVFTRESKNAGWEFKKKIPERWKIKFGGLNFWIKPTSFKHTGLFPEQSSNWKWIQEIIAKAVAATPSNLLANWRVRGGDTDPPLTKRGQGGVSVLNLFGYTGGATLAAAQAGAEVCHVDGSKSAVTWGRENAEISGLKDKPIRWIIDDAAVFVRREIKRGRKYDGIIMDPPAFGHGPTGEMWKIEDDFLPFLELCEQILTDKPLFFLINGYASGYSAIAYANNLERLVKKYGGSIEMGELTIQESKSKRLLPAGIFARWSSK